MEPLRKLRYDCSVPSIFQRTEQHTTKKTLSPSELHTQRVKNRENDCKSQLRSIASSLNGIAGLKIIQEKYTEAAEFYKRVLHLAKEYTGDICVDSLLQIHALNSLCGLPPATITLLELATYRKELKRLEWKYVESYYSLADAALNQLTASIETVDVNKEAMEAAYSSAGYKYKNIWYRECMYECQDNLLDRINNEIRTHYGSLVGADLKTMAGVDYVLTMWLEKVMTTRDHIQDAFDDLAYFYDNVKPKDQLAADAFKCHLDPKLKKDKPSDGEKVTCHLCELQNELNKYECVIFDKRLEENNVKGSWNPCYQETVLKCEAKFRPL
jgi:E3 ubiquitin-protein ligase SHPRH